MGPNIWWRISIFVGDPQYLVVGLNIWMFNICPSRYQVVGGPPTSTVEQCIVLAAIFSVHWSTQCSLWHLYAYFSCDLSSEQQEKISDHTCCTCLFSTHCSLSINCSCVSLFWHHPLQGLVQCCSATAFVMLAAIAVEVIHFYLFHIDKFVDISSIQ